MVKVLSSAMLTSQVRHQLSISMLCSIRDKKGDHSSRPFIVSVILNSYVNSKEE